MSLVAEIARILNEHGVAINDLYATDLDVPRSRGIKINPLVYDLERLYHDKHIELLRAHSENSRLKKEPLYETGWKDCEQRLVSIIQAWDGVRNQSAIHKALMIKFKNIYFERLLKPAPQKPLDPHY